jgi:microcystin-dependent protein
MFAGNFAPNGWMLCQGQLLPISEYETLFNLIGTTYGGDGQSTFALPDLQGRFPIHMGAGTVSTFTIGQSGGEEQVTLTTSQIPAHSHAGACSSQLGNSGTPTNAIWAQASQNANLYNVPLGSVTPTAMNAGAIAPTGGSQPHDNMAPFLVINFIISLFGVFPSQT